MTTELSAAKVRSITVKTTGIPAALLREWQVMDGAVRRISLGKGRGAPSFPFGKNVRMDLATSGVSPSALSGEDLATFVQRCEIALHLSAKRGHKYIHRSGYAIAFHGARGARIADKANEIAQGRNVRAKVRRTVKAESAK